MSEAKTKNMKSRAKTTKKVTETDTNRFLNLGDEVELSFGKFKIKELPAFDLLDVMGPSIELFMSLADDNQMQFFQNLIQSKDLRNRVCELFALFCSEKDVEQFQKCTIPDLKKLVVAIKGVLHLEEVKELFLELGSQNLLQTPISTE
jgi:hypothetical protein